MDLSIYNGPIKKLDEVHEKAKHGIVAEVKHVTAVDDKDR